MERGCQPNSRLGLVNEKNVSIKVADILDAARKDSFTTYLKAHNLEGPNPPLPNDWYNSHDCQFLRTRGFLTRKGYGTLIVYIGVAQFIEYLELIPNRDNAVDWTQLTVTDARMLSARLCHDIGIQPRQLGSFVHSIARATAETRAQLTIYGGKKLIKPPPWCVYKEAWVKVLAEERERHYSRKAQRSGSTGKSIPGLPPYGSRTNQLRAPRRTKRQLEADNDDVDTVASAQSCSLTPTTTPLTTQEEEEEPTPSSSSEESGYRPQRELMHRWLNPDAPQEPPKKKKKKTTVVRKVVVVSSEEEEEEPSSLDW